MSCWVFVTDGFAFLSRRFINSLSAKVHSSPPTIERIASLFQDFYARADLHIATHISALASRINRDPSPQKLTRSPRGSTQGRSNHKQDESAASGRQMLTPSEVTEKRKARKFLAHKQVALEEAVERRVCENVYDKIWHHSSSLDEVRDEKLRSKTASLSLVGVGMKDLGIEIDTAKIGEENQKEANDGLSAARDYLMKMNDEKYPLGKLKYLVAAHKAIVEALTRLLPSTSSADEILPTLIYTLITCPTEGFSVISNLHFIQRFRSSSKIDGEIAYCLTNLEAAITFVENVDISNLRAEETQDGQPKIVSAPAVERNDPLDKNASPDVTPVTASAELLTPSDKDGAATTHLLAQTPTSSSLQQQRLSNLFQPPSKVLGAANDAVRNTADHGLKNIGATLDSSLNFVLGRLKDMQPGTDGSRSETLADSNYLVAPSSPDDHNKHPSSNGGQSEKESIDTDQAPPSQPARSEDRLISLVGGRKPRRDRSVDSARTQSSRSKRAVSTTATSDPLNDESPSNPPQTSSSTTTTTTNTTTQAPPPPPSSSTSSSTPTPFNSMKNFGNSINPLNHIPGMIRNFGRVPSEPPIGTAQSAAAAEKKAADNASNNPPDSPSSSSVSKIEPPIQRLLDVENPADLRVGDVAVLLEDYKRLASALFRKGS